MNRGVQDERAAGVAGSDENEDEAQGLLRLA